MPKPIHLAAIAGFLGVAAAAFTVDLTGPRAESPLQFLLKQNRAREAPRTDYPAESVPMRGDGGFFSEFFGFEEERPQQRVAVTSNLQRVVCKRQCDGAQMVMGFMPAKSRQKEAEAMCSAAAGGAPAQLVLEKFVPGQGFAPVELASSAPLQEGRASLDATTAQPAAESACPKSQTRESFMTVPILNDATLRHGDVVATKTGFKVFVGGGKPPFKETDFAALDERKKVAADLRKLKVAGN
ncbi:hypothetical protein IZ6_26180 [Terrihabitans soli]|uniref:Uncharacterized protein n=1 Tax=Terrihabitans soli TaxID=708113 RepID=A0A6S6QKP9_9HYPH|nr:DUF2865 domain-containing protein [Terrihabitans soli]BCJ91883.1 hypothetical protein IZ6_26180 [Terrihabitans soli]